MHAVASPGVMALQTPQSRYIAIGLAATAGIAAGALLYYQASRTRSVARLIRHSVRGAHLLWLVSSQDYLVETVCTARRGS